MRGGRGWGTDRGRGSCLFYFYRPVAAGRGFHSPPSALPLAAHSQPRATGRPSSGTLTAVSVCSWRCPSRLSPDGDPGPWVSGGGEGLEREENIPGLYNRVCWWEGPQTLRRRLALWEGSSPAAPVAAAGAPSDHLEAESPEQKFPPHHPEEPQGCTFTGGRPASRSRREGVPGEGGGIGDGRVGLWGCIQSLERAW